MDKRVASKVYLTPEIHVADLTLERHFSSVNKNVPSKKDLPMELRVAKNALERPITRMDTEVHLKRA